jgi:transposase
MIQQNSLQFLKIKYHEENDAKVKQRLQIIIHLKGGKKQREVSDLLDLSVGIVPYWKSRFDKSGIDGLKDKKGRGRKAMLSTKDKKRVLKEVNRGIKIQDGYKRGYKTKDIAEMIRNLFGIVYTARHIRRLMHRQGYALKVPRPRNKSRNQSDVEEFKEQFKKTFRAGQRYNNCCL